MTPDNPVPSSLTTHQRTLPLLSSPPLPPPQHRTRLSCSSSHPDWSPLHLCPSCPCPVLNWVPHHPTAAKPQGWASVPANRIFRAGKGLLFYAGAVSGRVKAKPVVLFIGGEGFSCHLSGPKFWAPSLHMYQIWSGSFVRFGASSFPWDGSLP